MIQFAKIATRFAALAIVTLPLFGGIASAEEFKVGDITVEHPWARATPGRAKNGAAFMKIENHGGTDDRLMAASGDVASRVELHTHLHENGVMKMRPSGPVPIPAHGHAVLEPGSFHVMMIGLKAPLVEGEMFPLTLTFEKSGTVTVKVMVQSVGAGAGNSAMKHGMKHGHGVKKN